MPHNTPHTSPKGKPVNNNKNDRAGTKPKNVSLHTPSENKGKERPKKHSPRFHKPTQRIQQNRERYPSRHLMEGTIRVTAKGVGYVEIEGMDEDIEVDQSRLNTALDLDRVSIVLFGKVANRRQAGEVITVLFRNKTSFAGVIELENGSYFLNPDDQRMYRSILIAKPNLLGSKPGDKVFVEMTKWTNPRLDPTGVVKKVLGKANEHNAEMTAIALERGFFSAFEDKVEKAASDIPDAIPESEIMSRRDIRPGKIHSALTFTIDPKDAKDFDDALSFKKLSDGKFEVGVHIADVSYYVKPGSVIDTVACERATSVYLVDRTIPMLPERLSNKLCSLVPNEDRLTFSAIFTMDSKGEILDEWFGRSIIHSEKRFTYEEAQGVIDNKEGPCVDALLSLNAIAKNLRKERTKHGAIEFESREVKFELDAKGKPIGVYTKVMQDTNKLIEEFMLLANKRVAHLIATKDKRAQSVFLYRVHDAPDEDRIRDLRDFLQGIGFKLTLDKNMSVSAKSINKMLEDVRGHAEESMIQMATVRAMAKAVYTTKNIGHFGLGFDYYTHFTSPIRRYPDLMVHRLLARYLNGKPVDKEALGEEERLARYASQMEVSAAEAERASIKYKQCEYFSERIGTEIEGTISGVTEWGFYVEDKKTRSEGLIHVRDIPNDYYFFDQKHYRLVGREHGAMYRLGDEVRATITSVDMKKKQIGMKLVTTGANKKA